MPHIAQGLFRVVGLLVEGQLTVKYVNHCDQTADSASSSDHRVIWIRDDLWIDLIPLNMVAMEDRMPNTLLKVTVRDRTEVVHVCRAEISG